MINASLSVMLKKMCWYWHPRIDFQNSYLGLIIFGQKGILGIWLSNIFGDRHWTPMRRWVIFYFQSSQGGNVSKRPIAVFNMVLEEDK